MPESPSPAPLPRSLKWRLYGLVRPIVRPVARRIQMFLVGRLHDQVGQLQDDVGALRAEVRGLREILERERAVERATTDERVQEVMAQALATLALDRER